MGTVTHSFVNHIADDPAAAAAGQTLPSHWNANHALALTSADVGLGNVDNVSEATILAAAATAAAVLYRPKLAADQTKNVPADFATIEAALAYAATIDFNGFTLTIKLANGTYAPIGNIFNIPVTVGQSTAAKFIIAGDTTTPSNVVLHSAVAFDGVVFAGIGARARVQGCQFTGGGSTFGIHAVGGYLEYTACDFNTGFFAGAVSESGGNCTCVGTVTISASMTAGIYATNGGYQFQIGSVVTTANTPAWTAGYAWSDAVSFLRVAGGTTFGGTGATGTRYSVQRNAVIDVSGAGITYFPGNAGGFVATGGIYS